MLGLVGLLNNPGNEGLGLLPRLRQQFKGNHIEHLYGLVNFHINFPEIVEPKQQEAEQRDDDEDVEHNSA